MRGVSFELKAAAVCAAFAIAAYLFARHQRTLANAAEKHSVDFIGRPIK